MAIVNEINKLKITKRINTEICRLIKSVRFESGGIIGIDKNGTICEFQYDNPLSNNIYEYYPNTSFLNSIINESWAKKGIAFTGFVHSHPNNSDISPADINYACKIIELNGMDSILIGIVNLSVKTEVIKWYIVSK